MGEIAAIKMQDVIAADGSMRDRLYINPCNAKGGKGRTIFMNAKLIKEIEKYVRGLSTLSTRKSKRMLAPDASLIAPNRRKHFSPNSLCQLMNSIYALAVLVQIRSDSRCDRKGLQGRELPVLMLVLIQH